jgi:transmembrane sensor
MPERETADAIAEAASDWAARLDRGLSQAEQDTLENWLDGDSRRVGALARARALWSHAETALIGQTPSTPSHGRLNATRRGLLTGGAALAASLGGAGLWFATRSRPIVSNLGEIRRVSLEDGSSVTLGAETRILPRFGPAERAIELLAGEAFFDITPDAVRPFVVVADSIRVQTSAAAFGLRLIAGAPAAVLVERGQARVRVSDGHDALLQASERLILSQAGAPRLETLTPDAVQRGLAWRVGQLAFENEPLAAVADGFRRYGPVRIEIDDPELAREPVTGLFSASDPKGFAVAIAASLGARARIEGNVVRLERVRRAN